MAVTRMLLLLLAIFIFAECSLATMDHYIVPSMTSCPAGMSCTTMKTLLKNPNRYFTSNTTVTFKPGVYAINAAIKSKISVVIHDITNLTITGHSTEANSNTRVQIQCFAALNFIIVNSYNVEFSNIEFFRCGNEINHESFQNTKVYNALAIANEMRSQFVHYYQDLELNTPAQSTTLYFINSSKINLENTTISNTVEVVALVSVNMHTSLIVRRCLIEGGYRVWHLEDDSNSITLLEEKKMSYIIEQSEFYSKTIANNKQDAFTLISSQPKNYLLKMQNNLIASKSTVFGKGYIFYIILVNTNYFDIKLEHQIFQNGKTKIDVHNRKRSKASEVALKNSIFTKSSFDISMDQRKLILQIENSSFRDPIESLAIKYQETIFGRPSRSSMQVYLQNITVHRCSGYPAITLMSSTVYFDKSNEISFCSLTENIESAGSDSAYFTGGILCLESDVTFGGKMTFESNVGEEGGAIQAHEESKLLIRGELTFLNNKAFNGGALTFYEGSWMEIESTASIYFIHNYAYNFGGAIYIGKKSEDTCTPHKDRCFYEPAKWSYLLNYKVMTFINNTAGQAGDVMYAPDGQYADCIFPAKKKSNREIKQFSIEAFIRSIESYPSNISVFSSEVKQICYCTQSRPNCKLSFASTIVKYYPGQEFDISVVGIGVGYGSTPAFAQARVISKEGVKSFISRFQRRQETYKNCTSLTFSMHSTPGNHTLLVSLNSITLKSAIANIKLYGVESDISFGIYEVPLILLVNLQKCPPGFQFSNGDLICVCHKHLAENHIGCDINNQSVYREPSYWIYSHNNEKQNTTDVVIHKHCPHGYCDPSISSVNLMTPDEQCSHNRSGILCGSCLGNFSIPLGSNKCLECSNLWIPLILSIFILAGIVLVIFLSVLNLTVTISTINGLILYANILQPNNTILFPSTIESLYFMRTFIAWLNLDIGIEVCFYNGLDAFAKVLFQLTFPLYIWTMMILIIIGSHYSTRVAKISGRNAVQVLATLFLLSYTKVLRVIIAALSATSLDYSDHTKLVWLEDGNIGYLQGKHIFLFLLALILLVFLSIPYTAILFFSQCLQKWSNFRVIAWIWRVKPLFDAYTGPLKDEHRYWTGLLLLVRVILYIIYSTNVGGDPTVNILATSIMIACLLTYLVLIGGVYKYWPLTALECSYLLNLLILTSLTLFDNKAQNIHTNALVSIAFIVTLGTIIYHIYLRIMEFHCIKEYCIRREQMLGETVEETNIVAPTEVRRPPATSQIIYFDRNDKSEPLLICETADQIEAQKPEQ